MTAVIAYQSLNSNSSTEHSLDASTSQPFLRQAQRTLASLYQQGSGALKYPTSMEIDPHVALQGPAQLVPLAGPTFMDVQKPSRKRKRSETSEDASENPSKKPKPSEAVDEVDQAYQQARLQMLGMTEGKARQIYQQTYREFGERCDLVVFGELDSTHPDWHSMSAAAGQRIHVSNYPKACNCFSLHNSGAEIKAQPLVDGDGWCAAKCNGVLVVFVHVPNSVATKREAAIKFYNNIGTQLLTATGGGVIDVVMGDTNQASEVFSPSVISLGLAGDFKDGHASGSVTATDTWSPVGVSHRGTNSVNTKKFDVAVYNTVTVSKMSVRYISQLSVVLRQSAAYTDHMGLLVKVEKK